jgi:hypothetical protein
MASAMTRLLNIMRPTGAVTPLVVPETSTWL